MALAQLADRVSYQVQPMKQIDSIVLQCQVFLQQLHAFLTIFWTLLVSLNWTVVVFNILLEVYKR